MSVKREELVRDSLTLNLSRLYARVLELEERIESGREDLLEGYHEALREFRETFREFVRTRLRSFAEETMETGIEYLAFVTEDGNALILEGDEGRVTAPVKGAIAEVHTHPGVCLPSPQDLRTAWHLLSKGMLVFSVYSTECYFSISVSGPFTEDDYVNLLKLSNEVKKARTVEDYLEVLKKTRFEGLQVELLPP
jgi:hypothetical protein